MTIYIYRDKTSEGAAKLHKYLRDDLNKDARRLRAHHTLDNPNGLIVNWGNNTNLVNWRARRLLNNFDNVALAISKFRSLSRLQERDIPAVEVTKSLDVAKQWWGDEGFRVLTREDGLSNGVGINEIDNDATWDTRCDFWAKYFPKTHEFRVHVCRRASAPVAQLQVIDFTQKKLSDGHDGRSLVRNHENGWIMAHNDLHGTKGSHLVIKTLAIEAVKALDLDFAAVDVLARFHRHFLEDAVVCEINTRPGLENLETIQAYADAFVSLE